MKTKKLLVILVSAVALFLFAGIPAASADIDDDENPTIYNSDFGEGVGTVVGGGARAVGRGAENAFNYLGGDRAAEAVGDAAGAVGDAGQAAWGWLTSGNENPDITSFVDFKGGLTAPTGEGLDATLTKARTAREFIVNTLNFALSFLGIIAVAIVIYGGFLYVTAAGNEEQSTKGKKSIQYAAVGILIIIVSFALVNTLLKFGGGTGEGNNADTSGVRGSGEEGSNIGQQSIYGLGASAIANSMTDFVSAYKNLVAVNSAIKKMQTLPGPSDRERNRAYVSEINSFVTQIKNGTNALSKTHVAAQGLIDGWVSQSLATNSADGFDAALSDSGLEQAIEDDFGASLESVSDRLNTVKNILGEIADVPAITPQNRGLVTEKELKRAFSGLDPNATVKDVMNDAITSVSQAQSLSANPQNTALVVAAVRALDRLHTIIRNIEFVFVRVRATVKEGNAPLIVELNGLESRDPTGDTITDDRYEWDPIGATVGGISLEDPATAWVRAKNSTSSVSSALQSTECNTHTGSTIICTYNQPGTYIVRLKIRSTNPSQVATGQAFLPITVLPSVARISLKATVGSVVSDLRKYEQDENGKWNLVIDKQELQITTEEAASPGVSFDASGSQAGGGATIKGFEWNFGDGSRLETTETVQHGYKKGKFPLRLEVTDTGNRKDRKLMNVVIGSLAARTQVSTTSGEPDQLIEFDGSLSRSDKGSITSYEWEITQTKTDGTLDNVTNLTNKITLLGNTNSSVLRAKFKTPGSYNVTLNVSDGSDSATHTDTILIKSRKPRGNFMVRACPDDCPVPAQPSIVELDAGNSFDPDNDAMIFEWKVFSDQGSELTAGSSFEVLGGSSLQGKEAKKIRLKFNKTGKYKIQMTVKDDLPPELAQIDVKEKEVEVKSIVEAAWDSGLNPVSKMEDGKAHISFKGSIKFATRAQIDFGDSTADEAGITLGRNDSGQFEFAHDYERAGSFLVTLRALSEEGNGENTLTKRVYISGGNKPLAVIVASVDGGEVVLPESTPDNPSPALEIIRNKPVHFDASKSINSSGTPAAALTYSWDFGDEKRSTGATTEHSYADVSQEDSFFTVALTVTEARTEWTDRAQFLIKVVSKKPVVNTLALEKKTAGEVTPVDVELKAEGALDPDGRITNYQFWYYDPAEKERKLSVIDTQENHAILTVETAGEENQEHEYVFCVSATDNENTTSACDELFTESELPHLRVKNGPNKSPIADFSVDHTNVKVTETVTFTSSSTDSDGRITKYVWDFDGDGFQNDNQTELATVTHNYPRQSPASGYRVKLKVIDDKNASGFSKEVPIFVQAKSNKPVANFSYQVQTSPVRRVKFFDASTADTANGARLTAWKWDFDTSQEFGCEQTPRPASCNGNKTDDVDSTDQNPVFDFPASGTYQIKLNVEDSDGNVSEPKTSILSVVAGSGGTGGTTPGAPVELKASLRTTPAASFVPVPGCTPVTSDICKHKVVHFPATSNGENVTLVWGDSTGDIVSYQLDKNTLCDSNGDGVRGNDVDAVYPDSSGANSAGTCTGGSTESSCMTRYQRTARTDMSKLGHFNTELIVTDRNGAVSKDSVEIIFDGEVDRNAVSGNRCDGTPQSTLSASLFKNLGIKNTILLSLLAGVIVVLGAWGAAGMMHGGRKRN